MGAYRDESGNGTWFAKFTYTNWRGEKINKKKRGFKTKKSSFKVGRRFFKRTIWKS
ncbi:Arm DNA-binding domain-containing protein [Tissierella praeacuta]|uniref:Arm DNA-binding domain-containing protein n=1 Tax=Tissierella praeacuta TaxID=43131 RepID=UPI003DA22534